MDRRAFLRTAGVTAATTAALATDSSARNATTREMIATPKAVMSAAKRERMGIQSTLNPWTPGPGEWNATTIGHLYRRAGFGATQSEITAAASLTPGALVTMLLDDTWLQPVTPPNFSEKWLGKAPYLGSDYNTQVAQQQAYSTGMANIRAHWASQMTQPKTMLRERLVLFWMNHFVVESQKVYYPQVMYAYLDYFRQHAWGNFKQMVKDVTISPAMLIYLDGIYNRGTSPNENYARELQELFTMGVTDKDGNANYTQDDVEAVAHALTGWTVDTTAPAPNVLPAKYNISYHDSSFQKLYDGVKRQYNLTASGASMDKDLIDHMFDQRGNQIAWFICSKLYQFFVYHEITTDAEKAIVQELADTFKQNWSVKDVLSKLLMSEHFFDTANIGACLKSPYDHLVPMARQFSMTLDELHAGYVWAYTYTQGQYLLDPPNVKGWPGYHNWISTTTIPSRNAISTQLVISKSLPAGGSDGNGNTLLPISLDDASMIAWGKQFASYEVDFDSVLSEIATFLCAQPLGPLALSYVKSKLDSSTYEWTKLTDAEKGGALRQMVSNIMLLAEYQIY